MPDLPDLPLSAKATYYAPEVFQKYLPKGSSNVIAYLTNSSLVISYESENANRVFVLYPKNPDAKNISYLFIVVPDVESVGIYYRPDYITYNMHSSSKGLTFYPDGKTPAVT